MGRSLRILVWLLLPLLGQQAMAAPPRTLNFELLSVRDGLAQETVTAIVQDGHGHMWFGSQHGLSRYDGHRITVYNADADVPGSLADDWVQALHVDMHNRLWVGTRGALQRFDPATGRFTRFASGAVQAIADDVDGKLWAGTLAGLLHIDPAAGTAIALRHIVGDPYSLGDNRITALARDRSGNLWIGSRAGLDRLASGATRFDHFRLDAASRPDPALNEVQRLLMGRDQTLWIVSTEGLVAWQPAGAGGRRQRYGKADGLPPGLVTAILEDSAGTFWLGTNTAGLHRLDARTRKFVTIPPDPHAVAGAEVSSLFQDRSGTLWVGTWTAGVKRADLASGGFGRYFNIPGNPGTLPDNRIYGIGDDGAGALLLAGLGGITRLDPGSGKATPLRAAGQLGRHMNNKELVRATYRASNGAIWVGTSAGLGRFDPRSGAFHPRPLGGTPDSNSVTHIGGGPGQLWISTHGGLHRYDSENDRVRTYRHAPDDPHSLSDNSVTMTLADRDGALWVATDGGLNQLDLATGKFSHFRHDPLDPNSLVSDRVQYLFEDRDGTLWIGTNGGLSRMQRDAQGRIRFQRYTTSQGLGANSIGGILQDDAGMLWLSSAAGISRLDPHSGLIKNYTGRDGMIEAYYFAGAAYRDLDGTMYFGGVNGLTAFRPEAIGENPHAPQVRVTAIRVGGKPVSPGPTAPGAIQNAAMLTLQHGQPALELEFAALHFADPQRNRFSYQLQGVDREWIAADSGQRVATYTNLDPGTYRFRVKAANKDGIWSASTTPLVIEIEPPLWQRWWFRVPVALAFISMLWGFDYWRTRRYARRRHELEVLVRERTADVAQQNDELQAAQLLLQRYVDDRERLFISISHDLRTPITRLKLRSELLRDATVRDLFHEDLDDLDDMVKGALQTVKDSDIHENDIVVGLDLVFSRILRGTRLAGHKVIYRKCALSVRARPLALRRAIGNLIDNALFYGERVEITAERQADRIRLSIRDFGPGVAPDALDRLFQPHVRLDHGRQRNAGGMGLGLGIARSIVWAHGGVLTLENHPQGGLVATICLPAAD